MIKANIEAEIEAIKKRKESNYEDIKKIDHMIEILHNINNILKMSDITDYIYLFDLKNMAGCDVAIRGNAEKLAKMYDCLTKNLCIEAPEVMLRVMYAWDKGKGAANGNS